MTCTIASCPHRPPGQPTCPLEPAAAGASSPATRRCSLIVSSLELGRVLADQGKVTFRAQGTCMFPCIQPGDVLNIESRTIDQVRVGDIAVFRRAGALFGHRVVAKGTDVGKLYLTTRPDRAGQGADGPTCGADVLGVVTAIERRGARVPLRPQPLGGMAALRAAGWEWWNWEAWPRFLQRAGALQARGSYRRLASLCWRSARPQLSYVVRLPLNLAQSHDLYHEVSPDSFVIRQTQGRLLPLRPGCQGAFARIRVDHTSPAARAVRPAVVRTPIGRTSGDAADAAAARADHAYESSTAVSVGWLSKPVSISGALRLGSGRPERRRGAVPAPDAAPPSRAGDRRAVARPRPSLSLERFDDKRRRGGISVGRCKRSAVFPTPTTSDRHPSTWLGMVLSSVEGPRRTCPHPSTALGVP